MSLTPARRMLGVVNRRWLWLCSLLWSSAGWAVTPSAESGALDNASQRLARATSVHAVAEAWEIGRLFGAVSPAEILRALQPALNTWLSARNATTPTGQLVRHIALHAAVAAADPTQVQRLATVEIGRAHV